MSSHDGVVVVVVVEEVDVLPSGVAEHLEVDPEPVVDLEEEISLQLSEVVQGRIVSGEGRERRKKKQSNNIWPLTLHPNYNPVVPNLV